MDLNVIWFILIIVLFTGYAILDGFDLGLGATYLAFKNENQRQILLQSISPFWNGNEVWLVAAGGALFAAFPGAYASIFSGFYIPLMLLLIGIIFRALSIEFRNKETNILWRKSWDVVFSTANIVVLFVLGVAVGNLSLPLPLDATGNINIGFFQLFTPLSILIGLFSVFFFAMHGSIYAAIRTTDLFCEQLKKKATLYSVIAFVLFVINMVLNAGDFAQTVYQSTLINLIIIIAIALFFILIPVALKSNKISLAFVFSAFIIIGYIGMLAINLFPNWIISSINTNNNLTIYNTASSAGTLNIMFIMACIGMPVVIAYTIYVYRVFAGKTVISKH